VNRRERRFGRNQLHPKFCALVKQGAKDKPCVAKIQTIFTPQLLRAKFLISDVKSGLKNNQYNQIPKLLETILPHAFKWDVLK